MPIQLSMRVEGDQRVRVGLNRWANTLAPISRETIHVHVETALKRSIPYRGGNSYDVPERGYIRTGNLGRGGYVEQEGLTSRIRVSAYNSRGVDYSGYVVGDANGQGQAAIHNGYWVTLRNSVDQEVDEITVDVDQSIQASAEAIGL